MKVLGVFPTLAGDVSIFRFLSEQPGIELHVLFSYEDASGRGRADVPTFSHEMLNGVALSSNRDRGTQLVWNRRLVQRLRSRHPDVLFIGGYGNVAGARAIGHAIRRSIPWVMYSETGREGTPVRWRIKKAVLGVAVPRAAGFVTYGTQGERYLRALGAHCPIIVLGANRDLRRIAEETDRLTDDDRPNDRITFVYIGRLVRTKGVDLLAEAFARVVQEHGSARLLVVGDGPLRPDLEAYRDRGLPIELIGPIPYEGVAQVLAKADVLVLPSRDEPWGMVVAEALAARVPVIGSAGAGASCHYLPEGEVGWLVQPGDASALVRAMVSAMNANRTAMGNAARERVMRDDVRVTAARIAELFRDIHATTSAR